jgi:predicted nucleic acid-binding OB-fold protein
MWTIINAREKKPFTGYKEIQDRTGLTDVQKIITKRVLEELSTETKYRLFTRTV